MYLFHYLKYVPSKNELLIYHDYVTELEGMKYEHFRWHNVLLQKYLPYLRSLTFLASNTISTHTCESRMTINKANCGRKHIMKIPSRWRQESLKSLQNIPKAFYAVYFV